MMGSETNTTEVITVTRPITVNPADLRALNNALATAYQLALRTNNPEIAESISMDWQLVEAQVAHQEDRRSKRPVAA